MDMEAQVNAVAFGSIDRTLPLADGWAWARTPLSAEICCGPLSVVRPQSKVRDNDPPPNFRTMLRFD
jgi:hypothetical protein